eukprot:CAMPEP_0195154966 /NCGR_PEP_ID=MMETSP0448-20130528/183918_1 /TAXON_ID=66468 /ORGANISM="Heterocapsa triquestra, Strain CCMP 448" /LENGTH=919 /DNA_ID=CAMNT_0040193747 /DNA_START=69 /DNA_END=2826 /DNA_ORIENTATION=+
MAATGLLPGMRQGLVLAIILAITGPGAGKDVGKRPSWEDATCPGSVRLDGYGQAQIVPTGWKSMAVKGGDAIVHMGGRAYFADTCTAGHYDHKQYLALNLLGKTMRFSTDISGTHCGCNAALYLTSMAQNTHESECFDYYCDANNVCGESCAEIDIMEANMHAWHSTLHAAHDHSGLGEGFGGGGSGWNGPRDFTEAEYGPEGRCVDTTKPFDVAVSFPVDSQGNMAAMEVVLQQAGRSCPVFMDLNDYKAMEELSAALSKGMTPIVSYWKSEDMTWMDGPGQDQKGPCKKEHLGRCEDTIKFYNFSIEEYKLSERPTQAATTTTTTAKPAWAEPAWQWQASTNAAPTTAPTTQVSDWAAPHAVAEDEVCPKYMAETGCAWTRAFSCPGQTRGELGLATSDGSHGYTCCCEQELWKEVMGCDADYGVQPGEPVCCGQFGTAVSYSHICPEDLPTCVGFMQGERWGHCEKKQEVLHLSYVPANGQLLMRDEVHHEPLSILARRQPAIGKAMVGGGAALLLVAALALALMATRRRTHNRGDFTAPTTQVSDWAALHAALHAVTEDEVCPKYMAETGCAWTRAFSCPGQTRGELGLATSDGSHGYTCCCEKELWKEVMGCDADYGVRPGEPVCCGQSGTAVSFSHICPEDVPTCVGFKAGERWGHCEKEEKNQEELHLRFVPASGQWVMRDEVHHEPLSILARRQPAIGKAMVGGGAALLLVAALALALDGDEAAHPQPGRLRHHRQPAALGRGRGGVTALVHALTGPARKRPSRAASLEPGPVRSHRFARFRRTLVKPRALNSLAVPECSSCFKICALTALGVSAQTLRCACLCRGSHGPVWAGRADAASGVMRDEVHHEPLSILARRQPAIGKAMVGGGAALLLVAALALALMATRRRTRNRGDFTIIDNRLLSAGGEEV